jgi:hypothetical protein
LVLIEHLDVEQRQRAVLDPDRRVIIERPEPCLDGGGSAGEVS